MKTIVLLLAIGLTAVAALPRQERIIGGSVTTINTYPFAAPLLHQQNTGFRQLCGTTIITRDFVLTAAHCLLRSNQANRYRIRVGSTNANSGGSVHNANRIHGHPQYNSRNHDNDVGLVRVATNFVQSTTVRPGTLAGANINVPDNANVIAIGWGFTTPTGNPSEQLRHVGLQFWSLTRCRNAYGGGTGSITANMVCAGWQANGRGSCFGDSGTALIFNNVILGVTSFGRECASSRWPGVYASVPRFNAWIRNNSS